MDVTSFHFFPIWVILLFLLQLKKSICFAFFANQLFLGQVAWADTLDVSGGKVSHCTLPVCCGVWGLLLCLWGPSAERWFAICVWHYSFVMPSFLYFILFFYSFAGMFYSLLTSLHFLISLYFFLSFIPVFFCFPAALLPGHELPNYMLLYYIFDF